MDYIFRGFFSLFLQNIIRAKYHEKYLKNENEWQKVDNKDISDFSCVFTTLNNKTKQYDQSCYILQIRNAYVSKENVANSRMLLRNLLIRLQIRHSYLDKNSNYRMKNQVNLHPTYSLEVYVLLSTIYESAELRAKNVLACQRALRAYLLTCQRALRVYVLTCQRALRA